MRLLTVILLLTSFMAFMLSACDEIDNEIHTGSPIGLWERMIPDTDSTAFMAELSFNSNNTFDFIVLDTGTSHSNTQGGYFVTSNTIEFSDEDCSGSGIYQFSADTARLNLVVASEECSARRNVLQGVWRKK